MTKTEATRRARVVLHKLRGQAEKSTEAQLFLAIYRQAVLDMMAGYDDAKRYLRGSWQSRAHLLQAGVSPDYADLLWKRSGIDMDAAYKQDRGKRVGNPVEYRGKTYKSFLSLIRSLGGNNADASKYRSRMNAGDTVDEAMEAFLKEKRTGKKIRRVRK